MKIDLSDYSTEDLLRMSRKSTTDGEDWSYEAQQCLFKRWRNGIDLEYLVGLLESNTIRDRLLGAFFLGESDPRGDAMKEPALKLASDPLSNCRRAFVGYMTNSGLYSEKFAAALAECILDFAIEVRTATINWALYTTDDRFDNFARLVEAGTGTTDSATWREPQLKRGLRALGIARRLRNDESVDDIRKSTPEEDSYTFDHFECFKSRTKRYIEKRKVKSLSIANTTSEYDEYEIGVLGETYDNLGKLKGDLPTLAPSGKAPNTSIADLKSDRCLRRPNRTDL